MYGKKIVEIESEVKNLRQAIEHSIDTNGDRYSDVRQRIRNLESADRRFVPLDQYRGEMADLVITASSADRLLSQTLDFHSRELDAMGKANKGLSKLLHVLVIGVSRMAKELGVDTEYNDEQEQLTREAQALIHESKDATRRNKASYERFIEQTSREQTSRARSHDPFGALGLPDNPTDEQIDAFIDALFPELSRLEKEANLRGYTGPVAGDGGGSETNGVVATEAQTSSFDGACLDAGSDDAPFDGRGDTSHLTIRNTATLYN